MIRQSGNFADRDRVRKDDNGENLYENTPSQEGHEGHYQFENAPEKSTYVEITGKFEGNNISAETKYILHLGDFSNNKFNDVSTSLSSYSHNQPDNGTFELYINKRNFSLTQVYAHIQVMIRRYKNIAIGSAALINTTHYLLTTQKVKSAAGVLLKSETRNNIETPRRRNLE